MSSVVDSSFGGTERFQLIRRLGAGGMGVVFEAWDRERATRVALKTLRTGESDALRRFKREFHAFADLHHENLVRMGELVADGGTWFFTMELVEGVDFLEWVRPFRRRPPSEKRPLTSLADAESVDTATGFRLLELERRREGPPLDEPRLREALRQLASALHALHGAHKVHRDIKPSNILVTPEGRLVVLDYGLFTDTQKSKDASHSFSDAHVVGTADYMAPEQAASRRVGPEADWYSVGVLLYEALTERLPFAGPPLEVLMNKQRYEPVPPRAVAEDVPEDLDVLCCELLRFDPASRPSAAEVLRRLGVPDASERLRLSPVPAPADAVPFVGRARELELLRQAWADSRQHAVTVLVEGDSGVGKSALTRRFADELREHGALVLEGRCFPREAAPFKAWGGIVESLARHLQRLPSDEAAALLPVEKTLLAQVFPALGRVPAVAQARARLPQAPEVRDPQERRNRVFAALAELCLRVAERKPLVMVIEDLQWADADSLALLGKVLEPPDAPALLVLATTRGNPWTDRAPLLDVRPLPVLGLPPEDARLLAARLLARREGDGDGEPAREAEAIADEAGGHPLFIAELARHLREGQGAAGLALEAALWARIARLDAPAREVLALISLAGRPLPVEAVLRAAALPFEELARHAALLRAAHLARSGGARGADAIEPYHDRVRAAVLGQLPPEDAARLHRRLALALETDAERDLEALAVHWRGAGERPRAAEYAAQAAAQAAQALAFDRAARLYRQALELDPDGPEARKRRTRLGDALALAGRGGEAAQAYLAAVPGASDAEALELEQRAAGELLRSGRIDEGLAALTQVLRALGESLPETPRGALLSLLWQRARLGLRGLGYEARDASQLPPRELARLDVYWSVAIGLGLVDTLRGSDFQARHLALALELGEPERISRALCLEATFLSSRGHRLRRRTEKLYAEAQALAERVGHPHALGFAVGSSGLGAYLRGDFRAGLERCDRGERLLREHGRGVAWEINTLTQFACAALGWLGELDELARRVPRRLREAEERGDLYAVANLRLGHANLVWLAADEPDEARAQAELAVKTWSRAGFHLQHYYDLFAQANIDIYRGDGKGALERCLRKRREALKSQLLSVELVRLSIGESLGRAALCAAAAQPRSARKEALAIARAEAAALGRVGLPFASALGQLLSAAVRALSGDRGRARDELDRAAAALADAGLGLHAHAARRELGQLTGGDEGRALVEAADRWLKQERVRDPERMAALFAPGFRG